MCSCFRPIFGVSLFLLNIVNGQIYSKSFSSPLRGISISTLQKRLWSLLVVFSSPLRGISISTNIYINDPEARKRFRPLFGVSLFLQCGFDMYKCKKCFRPLFGVSLFLPFLVFPLKIQRELSGLRCKRTNQIISCS